MESTSADRPWERVALPVGARLGEMEIVRVLAVGGFGIVYLARDHSLDRDVAVKEFMPSHLAGRGLGQRVTVRSTADADTYALGLQSFVNEAKLLAHLSHPAMVKVYRFWEGNGTAYMAMPYLRGPTLTDVRRSMSEAPSEAWLRSMIDPLLDALAMLHAQGIYHRDIAPDNVLISGPGLPVLLDFGAARRVVGDRTQSLTAVLKPHYAPIEQYAETRNVRQGPWTDLYALASVVAYLLDGQPPPPSTARCVDDEMPPLAERQIADVSVTFLAAMDWALAVAPQDRPQSVDELRSALNGLSTAPARSRAPRFAATAREPAPVLPWNRFSGRWVAGLAAGVLVALAVAWPSDNRAPTVVAPARADLAARANLQTNIVATPTTEPPVASGVVRAGAAPVSAPRPALRHAHRATRFVAVRVKAPGPVELCASRNFFVRPYCVAKRCEEAAFKGLPQCAQLQQTARNRHE